MPEQEAEETVGLERRLSRLGQRLSKLNLRTSFRQAQEKQAQQQTAATKEIAEYTTDLKCIFDMVEDTTSTFLDPHSYNHLSIQCEKLELNHNGTYSQPEPSPSFFEPRSPALLHEFPLDFEGKMQQQSRNTYESFGDKIESYTRSATDSSIGLCYEVDRVFYSYPRHGIHPGKQGLSYFTIWRQSGDFDEDAVFWSIYWSSLFTAQNPCWQPESAYVSSDPEYPHVMFTIRHEIEPDVADLLRGEVLAIIAAIITRLEYFDGKHRYIPVLVFSMMGKVRGRILQAYYDGENVVIWKSQLYCFEPLEDARKLFDIFVQHMASIPRGITRNISKSVGEETQ